jgi:hypothetical protein
LERERERERERDNQQVSDTSISRANVTIKVEKSNGVVLFLLFVFIDLRKYITDSIEKGIFSFISINLKPLRKEKYSFLKGFFILNETQKLSRFYETICGDTETYSPETFCVKSFIPWQGETI